MGEFQERQVVGIHSDSTICEFTFHAFPMLCGNRQRVPSQIEKEREKLLIDTVTEITNGRAVILKDCELPVEKNISL